MALSRNQNVVAKLEALVGKNFTPATIEFAVDNWENADFPRKLESQVRRWMQENGNKERFAGVIARYAKADEQSAKWLVDPVQEAQDAILKLNDEDDLAVLLKRCTTFTSISARLWKAIAASDLSERVLSKLAGREDAPRAFVREHGAAAEEKPARSRRGAVEAKPSTRAERRAAREAEAAKAKTSSRRSSRAEEASDESDEDEAPKKPSRRSSKIEVKPIGQRGRTGSAERVSKPSRKAVSDDMDFPDEKPQTRKPGKTVKKIGKLPAAIQKIRKVVGPEKPVVRSNAVKKASVEKPLDTKKVRSSARQVRRPKP